MTPDTAVDATLFGLILSAPIVVQIVLLGLLIAAGWSAVTIVQKLLLLLKMRKEADKFEQVFWSGQSLEELYQALAQRRNTGMASLFVAAMREWKRSTEQDGGDGAGRAMTGLQLRVEKVMNVTSSREVERLGRRMNFLSIMGAIAPLIGLLGGAWGLMTSFQAAAANGAAGLSVMAPGAAQALLAVALGLFVAIPCVIFYHKFKGEIARYAARLNGFANEFAAILSRQIDRM